MKNIENIENLLEAVRQIAYDVHVYLSNGYLEKVYENCLKHRLEKAGYDVETQANIKIFDEDGYEIGDYFADMVVNKCLIVELKAAKTITAEHLSQAMNYLKATGYPLGLVINFGSYKFETRKVYPPVCEVHRERVGHEEEEGVCGASSCSTGSRWKNKIIHGECEEHGEGEHGRVASPCSQCSPRKNREEIIRGEREEHREEESDSLISSCSTSSPRKNIIIHGEHVEHGEGERGASRNLEHAFRVKLP